MSSSTTPSGMQSARRGAFSGRSAFLFAAIGSAVGLGNIWRFPKVAYDNGGGAFMIPYLIALLTAGIPLLLVDYAIGHRWRGSAPLAWRRMARWGEFVGWWQVLICAVIATYYALIIAWAGEYTVFSINGAWGSDAAAFFGSFTQAPEAKNATVIGNILWPTLIAIVLVWLAMFITLALGVKNGIAKAALFFIPLLMAMFLLLVGRSLFLPGAIDGLTALFTPNWSALTKPDVWIAAYGQIFYSLSVAFGIMLTYASYLRKKSDLTGSALVVAFSNSGFELLAGIGVFSALGFMAQAQGVELQEVVSGGIGLAFIAFPTIVTQAPGGMIIGILFFGCLVIAGFTSLVSVVEVIVSAVQDKFGMRRPVAAAVVTVPLGIASTVLFSTSMGLPLLDVLDKFATTYGIIGVALVATIVASWIVRALPTLASHLNHQGSIRVGMIWMACVAVIVPIALTAMLFLSTQQLLTEKEPYGGYPAWFVLTFGWGMAALLVIAAIVLSLLPWSRQSFLHMVDSDGDPVPPPVVPSRRLSGDVETPHELRSH